ncbi:lipoprotein LipL45 [Leptospira sp. GIMC2001]|uniref:lipoprotein LipL45 n=1 Tax=Leptospira sp. GIMC2001 TaxID=1513297 RepID=UPI0004A5C406|nr:lipoprotein LipL45 [Leptospira sp. GIMC2001]AID56207.1 LipL45 protein [Leptospira sp. GIMC2001]WCL50917.1 lipoprotein LipL45 [Leptospira sp. GIMC2001]
MKQVPLKVVLIVSALSILTLVCKKPDTDLESSASKGSTISAVIVFSVGDSKVSHADGTEERAQLGASVKTGDTIKTGEKGKVDLQLDNGSSIRIAPSTTLDFAKLAMNASGSSETQLALVSGKVFANVNKAKKDDNFSIVTPTAIAGVRGTSFIVENDAKTNKAKVKVVDGAVAMSSRIPALENLKPEEIEANADYKKLVASIESSSVVLEKGQQASLKSDNKKLVSDIDKLDVSAVSLVVANEKPEMTQSSLTKSEEQELKTIVKVDEATAKELVDLNQKGASSEDATKLAEIEKKRKEIEEKLAGKQEVLKKEFENSLAEKPKTFTNKKDIVSYYERIEKIVLTNGSFEVGAIINQENNTMIVHTELGIKKINLDDVEEVIYDYQSKTKF